MTTATLRKQIAVVARYTAPVGLLLMACGLWFTNAALVALGCVILFVAGYAMIFAKIGSY